MEPIQKLSRSIAGKVALVTGAASGMGRATAHVFAAEGAKVALLDLRQERVDAVVAEIKAEGGEAHGWALDVADAEGIIRVVKEIEAHFGGLDILVNNAGLSTFCGIAEEGYEESWARALEVMLTAHMRFVRAALPLLKRSGEGRIVNVASTEGFGATPGNSSYVAAKHGVIGLTRALAVELGREGVTCNCICPGPIRTGITDGIPDEHKEIFAKRRVPLRRYGDPEEVAHVTLSVVLPASSYLNGVAIPVDGGMLVKNA
ncbi:MAG: SDR family NAD(P)-dependent oxidoreductase [Parvibaculum sp.]|uniref:SDR family NAD(P)-dependent oxidoreductase n=1 Tax=Parvibaculum sp. TaxID=2024848 RepID=UPI0027203179|nr:SDR family NAD(P)-dependent oxidoreductase [Parvibaculum sp.]MDO8837808.1 SDR family NAD(P)-dependent oxidoreductase [Parvibaculum sp.]